MSRKTDELKNHLHEGVHLASQSDGSVQKGLFSCSIWFKKTPRIERFSCILSQRLSECFIRGVQKDGHFTKQVWSHSEVKYKVLCSQDSHKWSRRWFGRLYVEHDNIQFKEEAKVWRIQWWKMRTSRGKRDHPWQRRKTSEFHFARPRSWRYPRTLSRRRGRSSIRSPGAKLLRILLLISTRIWSFVVGAGEQVQICELHSCIR